MVRLPGKCSAAEANRKMHQIPQAQTCTQVKVATPICGCDDSTSRSPSFSSWSCRTKPPRTHLPFQVGVEAAQWMRDRRLQYPTASLVAEIPHPCGLCRPPHRNGRSATQPRPAPPIVNGSTCATRRTNRDSNCCWMKTPRQVRGLSGNA